MGELCGLNRGWKMGEVGELVRGSKMGVVGGLWGRILALAVRIVGQGSVGGTKGDQTNERTNY